MGLVVVGTIISSRHKVTKGLIRKCCDNETAIAS